MGALVLDGDFVLSFILQVLGLGELNLFVRVRHKAIKSLVDSHSHVGDAIVASCGCERLRCDISWVIRVEEILDIRLRRLRELSLVLASGIGETKGMRVRAELGAVERCGSVDERVPAVGAFSWFRDFIYFEGVLCAVTTRSILSCVYVGSHGVIFDRVRPGELAVLVGNVLQFWEGCCSGVASWQAGTSNGDFLHRRCSFVFFVSRFFPIQLRPAALAVFVVIIDADFSFDVIDLRVHLVIPLVRERISANPSSISINICTWFDCHRPSIFVEGDLSEKTIPSSDEFMRSVFSFLLDAERA